MIFNIYPEDRVAILIDGISLHKATKSLDRKIDFGSLRRGIADNARLVTARYYTSVPEDRDERENSIFKLIDWLSRNGYVVEAKTTREFRQPDGNVKFKSSILVELSVDAMSLSGSIDHLVLISGDGDYAPLVRRLQQQGVRITVMATRDTLSDRLHRQADEFIDLEDAIEVFDRYHAGMRNKKENS